MKVERERGDHSTTPEECKIAETSKTNKQARNRSRMVGQVLGREGGLAVTTTSQLRGGWGEEAGRRLLQYPTSPSPLPWEYCEKYRRGLTPQYWLNTTKITYRTGTMIKEYFELLYIYSYIYNNIFLLNLVGVVSATVASWYITSFCLSPLHLPENDFYACHAWSWEQRRRGRWTEKDQEPSRRTRRICLGGPACSPPFSSCILAHSHLSWQAFVIRFTCLLFFFSLFYPF